MLVGQDKTVRFRHIRGSNGNPGAHVSPNVLTTVSRHDKDSAPQMARSQIAIAPKRNRI